MMMGSATTTLGYLSPEGRGRRVAPGEGFSLTARAEYPLTLPSPLRGEGSLRSSGTFVPTTDINSREQSHG